MQAMNDTALNDLDVVVPNLHWRYSGVTATNRMIAPRLARHVRAGWLGRDAPEGLRRLGLLDLLRLWRTPRNGHRRIWHARRNNEMLAGLVLTWLGWPFALVFTSAGQRPKSWLTGFLIGRMDAVIATSAISASFVQRPTTVIHHGIDPEIYRPPVDRAAALAASGVKGRYAIGCFGRVRAQKGTDVFVSAMCRLLPRFPDWCAVVVGPTTPDQAAFADGLRAQVEAAGLGERVHLLGELPIEDVPPWYQRITIYAFTSRNEGFGLTLLEAMAAENAVVAARAGAAEVVINDGDTGLLVPPGDVDALTVALEPLLRDPAQATAMGARARARVLAEFSVDAEAERIVEVYRRVWSARQ
jgi:mannosyltransferase